MKDAFNKSREQASLLPRWQALWQRFGAEDTGLAAAGWQIIDAYSTGRHYHSQEHLASVLAELDWAKSALDKSGELSNISADARQRLFDTVELALWYHDVVYDAKAKDNEAQSRNLFLSDAKKFGLPAAIRDEVAALIDLTAHHKDAKTLAERLMTDCDLAVLGGSPAAFCKYDTGIRKEYAHVPPAVYKVARRDVLKSFLDQAHIFKTAAFRQKLEKAARKNLSGAIAPARRQSNQHRK